VIWPRIRVVGHIVSFALAESLEICCAFAMGCAGSTVKTSGTDYDHLFKLVLVGEVGVGKSSLV
jgi:hypothetical protein